MKRAIDLFTREELYDEDLIYHIARTYNLSINNASDLMWQFTLLGYADEELDSIDMDTYHKLLKKSYPWFKDMFDMNEEDAARFVDDYDLADWAVACELKEQKENEINHR